MVIVTNTKTSHCISRDGINFTANCGAYVKDPETQQHYFTNILNSRIRSTRDN